MWYQKAIWLSNQASIVARFSLERSICPPLYSVLSEVSTQVRPIISDRIGFMTALSIRYSTRGTLSGTFWPCIAARKRRMSGWGLLTGTLNRLTLCSFLFRRMNVAHDPLFAGLRGAHLGHQAAFVHDQEPESRR